ncbi:putative 1-deoxy-D-xylulose 5-phosphate synthase [Streptomyces misionensis JCM 4497]
MRHRPLRHHPPDGRRVRRPAGGRRLRGGRRAGAVRRAGLGRAGRLHARLRRQLRLSAPGLPVPHRPADAVPVRVDGDALHPADHVHRRGRLRPVPRLPRPRPRPDGRRSDRPRRHRPGGAPAVARHRAHRPDHRRDVDRDDRLGGPGDRRRRLGLQPAPRLRLPGARLRPDRRRLLDRVRRGPDHRRLRLPRLQHHRLHGRRDQGPRPGPATLHPALDRRHHDDLPAAPDRHPRRRRLASHDGPARHRRHLGRLRGAGEDLGPGGRRHGHRAHPDHRVRLGVHGPAGRLPGAVRRGARPGLLPAVRAAAPPPPLPDPGPGHHGRDHRRRLPDRPAHRSRHPDPVTHHGDGDRPGARPDRRADGAACPAAGAAPAVPDVALPGARPRGLRRLVRDLRLRRPQLTGPPPHRMVPGLARPRLRGLPGVGQAGAGVAVRGEGDRRGVPREDIGRGRGGGGLRLDALGSLLCVKASPARTKSAGEAFVHDRKPDPRHRRRLGRPRPPRDPGGPARRRAAVADVPPRPVRVPGRSARRRRHLPQRARRRRLLRARLGALSADPR